MKRYRNNPFAIKLFQALIDAEMTQKQLAELTGLTQVSISRYICGDRIPNSAVAKKLADALGVSVDSLCILDAVKYRIEKDYELNGFISKQAVIDAILGDGPPEPHYPSWYVEKIKQL